MRLCQCRLELWRASIGLLWRTSSGACAYGSPLETKPTIRAFLKTIPCRIPKKDALNPDEPHITVGIPRCPSCLRSSHMAAIVDKEILHPWGCVQDVLPPQDPPDKHESRQQWPSRDYCSFERWLHVSSLVWEGR